MTACLKCWAASLLRQWGWGMGLERVLELIKEQGAGLAVGHLLPMKDGEKGLQCNDPAF